MNGLITHEQLILAPPTVRSDGAKAVRQTLRLWRRHLGLFLAVAILTLAIGITVLLLLTPTYTATATVAIAAQNADPLAPSGQQVPDRVEDDRPATEAAMLQSRDVAASVVKQIPPLPEEAGFSPRARLCHVGVTLFCPTPGPTDPDSVLQRQIDGFLTTLTVMPEMHSRVIDISVVAKTGARAAALANAVVVNYQRQSLDRQTADVNRVTQWLDARTTQLRQRWLDAVQRADSFDVANNLTNTSDGVVANPLIDRQITEIAGSLSDAQARLASSEAKADALRDAAQHGNARAVVSLAQQPILVASANALMQMQSTRDQQAAQLGSNHPQIRALDQQIAAAQASLNRETGAAVVSIREDAVAARAAVRQLTDNLDQLRAKAGTQSAPQATYRSLSQEAQSERTVYETFLDRAKMVVDRAALLQAPVSFVSHAAAPQRPTFPNKTKLGLGIVVLALALATASVLIRSYFSRGFQELDQLRLQAQLPVLGSLPLLSLARGRRIARHVLDDPLSRTSEGIRGLAAQLSLLASKDASQTVLITSASPAEGKSTLAVWLAIAVRQGGQSVLVVDSDHRRASLMQHLKGRNAPGLTDLLAGRATHSEVIQTDPDTGVDFIAAGTAMTHPFTTADITRLRSLLGVLKTSYAMIVIDTPPLLAMADALVYARLADQTVFVCRWEHTSRQAMVGCLDRLRSYGAVVSGVVVTMVNQRSGFTLGDDYSRRELALLNRVYGG